MTALLEQLIKSPTLPEILDELQARLNAERARREKFYQEITEDMKAEFINGEVILHSPAREKHLAVRDHLSDLLRAYVRTRNLELVRGEKALCVFPRNDYEPDVCFFGLEKARQITPDLLRFPIPDFIAEVLSPSTEDKDRGEKLQDYAAHGVREYWIIDPDAEILEQYLAHESGYRLALKSGSGEVCSVVIPDFCIPVRALFD